VNFAPPVHSHFNITPMKLIIQIPCFNEEQTLAQTIADLPTSIPGIDQIELLIINDGSNDRTVEVAKENGVHHIVSHCHNRGLAKTFMTGLRASLDAGADIIVNTDADNQYFGADIEKLVAPIIAGESEIVIGERPIMDTPHFSTTKKILQRLGTWVVRLASNTRVGDAPSGFRAFSREAAMQLNVFSEYTYTLETIIQAGQKGMVVSTVPIRTNGDLRPSRLVKSIPAYVKKSTLTIGRIFIIYRPFRFFAGIGSVVFLLGVGIGIRFLILYFQGVGAGNVQSLILAAVLLTSGLTFMVVGVLSDLIAVNRKLLEEISYKVRQIESKVDGS